MTIFSLSPPPLFFVLFLSWLGLGYRQKFELNSRSCFVIAFRFPPVRLPPSAFNQPYYFILLSVVVRPVGLGVVGRSRNPIMNMNMIFDYCERYGVISSIITRFRDSFFSFLKCAHCREIFRVQNRTKLKLSSILFISSHNVMYVVFTSGSRIVASALPSMTHATGRLVFFLKCRYICVKRKNDDPVAWK